MLFQSVRFRSIMYVILTLSVGSSFLTKYMMKYSAFSIIKRDKFDDLIDLKVMNLQVVFEFCLFHLK